MPGTPTSPVPRREVHHPQLLLAVLLRPGRQPHLARHRARLPTRHHLHLQRRLPADFQERLHHQLGLRQDGQRTRGCLHPEGTRAAEKCSDFSQLTSLTVGGTTYPSDYGSTDSSERHRLGDTYYHPGPIGQAAETTAGVDTGFVREPEGTLNSMTRNGKAYHYLTDESGTKVNTYAYSPRDVTRSTTTEQITQPYQFAGGHHDPTGRYRLGARYYDPNIGHFTQPDPSDQEKNSYLYAEGHPVNHIDPTGLSLLSGLSSVLDKAESVVGIAQGCIAGVRAASETGVITYAGAGAAQSAPESAAQ